MFHRTNDEEDASFPLEPGPVALRHFSAAALLDNCRLFIVWPTTPPISDRKRIKVENIISKEPFITKVILLLSAYVLNDVWNCIRSKITFMKSYITLSTKTGMQGFSL